jgi:hypothetical protein
MTNTIGNTGNPMGLKLNKLSPLRRGRKRNKPLGLTRSFFENLESESGKDYGWIKPFQPVSSLMM